MTESDHMVKSSTIDWKMEIFWFVIAMLPALIFFQFIPSKPFHDATLYWDSGMDIAHTGIYGKPGAPEGYTPPGYAFFVSLVIRAFGEHPRLVACFNLCFFAGSLLLARYIGGHLYDRKTGIAAMLFSGWVYDMFSLPPLLLSENLFITMFLGSVALMIGGTKRTVIPRFLAAGILLGLATLVRATTVMLLPFLGIGLLLWIGWSWRRRLMIGLYFLVVIVGFMIPVGAWTYRNYKAFGFVFPICLNSGDNLALGNNPVGTFWYVNIDDPLRKKIGIDAVDPVERYKAGRAIFMKELTEHPVRSVLRCFPRLWYSMTDIWPWFSNPRIMEFATSDEVSQYWSLEAAMNWEWAAFLILTVGGVFFGRHLSSPERLLILGICCYWLGLHSWMHIHPRYRVPIIPFFALYAGYFCTHVLVRLRKIQVLVSEE